MLANLRLIFKPFTGEKYSKEIKLFKKINILNQHDSNIGRL